METNNKQVKFIVPVPEKSSRLLAALTLLFLFPKAVLLIPHLIILWALGIAMVVVAILGQVVVLFTGKYPEQMHHFVVGTLRWRMRVTAYLVGLRDEYPPFTLEE